MKTLVFAEYPGIAYFQKFRNRLESKDLIFYSSLENKNNISSSSVNYKYLSHSPDLYTEFLKICRENNFNAFIPLAYDTSDLYFELLSEKLDIKMIVGIPGLHNIITNKATKLKYQKLRKIPNFKLFTFTIFHDQIDYFDGLVDFVLPEPIYDEDHWYKNKNNQGYFLFAGAPNYGKGLDYFIESAKRLKSYNFKIISNLKKANYDLDINNLSTNIQIISEKLDDLAFAQCINNAKAVVLPYRKTYEYGTSGIVIQCCQAKTPIIAPNMKPFNLVKNNKIGLVFEAEDIDSLTSCISNFDNYNFNNSDFNAYFSGESFSKQLRKIIE